MTTVAGNAAKTAAFYDDCPLRIPSPRKEAPGPPVRFANHHEPHRFLRRAQRPGSTVLARCPGLSDGAPEGDNGHRLHERSGGVSSAGKTRQWLGAFPKLETIMAPRRSRCRSASRRRMPCGAGARTPSTTGTLEPTSSAAECVPIWLTLRTRRTSWRNSLDPVP
jgi:hypothetical protein